MQHEEFVGQVQHRARLGTQGEAERAIQATLETLAERLGGREAEHLAAELPYGIKNYLQKKQPLGDTASFSLDEFFERVSQKEGIDLPEAIFHARAVIDVLSEAVSRGEIDDVRSQLPPEYQQLFEAGTAGKMDRQA